MEGKSGNSVQLKRSHMNALIMDYLVAEGFKEAAERFSQESGIELTRIGGPGAAVSSVLLDQRIMIREAIEEGTVIEAIRLINKYYPELLDQNRSLYFKLQVRFRLSFSDCPFSIFFVSITLTEPSVRTATTTH